MRSRLLDHLVKELMFTRRVYWAMNTETGWETRREGFPQTVGLANVERRTHRPGMITQKPSVLARGQDRGEPFL